MSEGRFAYKDIFNEIFGILEKGLVNCDHICKNEIRFSKTSDQPKYDAYLADKDNHLVQNIKIGLRFSITCQTLVRKQRMIWTNTFDLYANILIGSSIIFFIGQKK